MILGFSTGTIHVADIHPISPEVLSLIARAKGTAVEFHADTAEGLRAFKYITKDDLAGFERLSLHAPGRQKYTRDMLDIFQEAHNKLGFSCVVLHPHLVTDWSLFEPYAFPIAVENMDKQKPFGASLEDMENVFDDIDAKMVLDLNHCFTLDSSMQLAHDLYKRFSDRIVEIHISGYDKLHEPLYLTKQIEIIKAIPDKNLPIIIESVFNSPDELQQEFDYITQNL